jgi:hypothetical protein
MKTWEEGCREKGDKKNEKMGCRRWYRKIEEGWRRETGEKRMGIQNGERGKREKEEKRKENGDADWKSSEKGKIDREGGWRLEKGGERRRRRETAGKGRKETLQGGCRQEKEERRQEKWDPDWRKKEKEDGRKEKEDSKWRGRKKGDRRKWDKV